MPVVAECIEGGASAFQPVSPRSGFSEVLSAIAVTLPFFAGVVGVSPPLAAPNLAGRLNVSSGFWAQRQGRGRCLRSASVLRAGGEAPGIAVMIALKLIVHPLLAYLLLTQLGVTGIERVIGTLIAAMPVAGNVFVIAEMYGVLMRRSSALLLISAVLAILAVAFTMKLFSAE